MRAAFLAALLLPLGGCFLNSEKPLIAKSDQPAEPIADTYASLTALPAARRGAVPEPQRSQCADPGYSGQERDDSMHKQGLRVRLVYCAWDVDDEYPLPPTRLVARDDGFDWEDTAPRAANPDEEIFGLRLRRLQPGLYLAQFHGRTQGWHAIYALFRVRQRDLELFLLECADFPSVAKPVPGTAAYSGNARQPDRPPLMDCPITSLESVRPELDAVVARIASGQEAPFAILRRSD